MELSQIPGIEFNPVVFEVLVDLSMPEIGDFSWIRSKEAIQYDGDTNKYFDSIPDVPDCHKTIGNYYHVLAPYAPKDEVNKNGHKCESVSLNYGSYSGRSKLVSVDVDLDLIAGAGMIRVPQYLIREEAFSIMAPHLDLDYFSIAVANIGDRADVLNTAPKSLF